MKNIVILGPGGLGGVIAALLAHKGECQVTIVGRPGAHIEKIQRDGLSLKGLKELTAQVDATDDAKTVKECDGLFIVTKAQNTEEALAITEHIHVRDFVVSLQNGVIKDDMLAATFSKEKVIGALSIVGGERPEPGVVNWTFDGGTLFGELEGGSSERVEYVVELFKEAGLISEASDAILSATWTKMVGWIGLGLLGALARQNNAGVFSNRPLVTTFIGMVRELRGLAEAKGIPLIDLGPYHIKTWCQGTLEEAVEEATSSPLIKSQSTHSASQDIQKGYRTEFSACVGPVIEEARKNSVPIKVVEAMYATLMGLEQTL